MPRLHGRYTYNLPPLDEGHMPEAGKPGVWLPVEHLEKLADALAIGESEAERGDIKSIPDPWAQMLVFDRALFDANHPLHTTVLAQWRALIATLALQPEYEAAYSLTVVPLDLTPPKAPGGKTASAEQVSTQTLFARTLLGLEPKRVLASELSWKQPAALMFQQKSGTGAFDYGAALPLGFLTPTALVAAGRGSEQVHCKDVPWLRDGLTDPSNADLSDRHFRILADYVRNLATALNATKKKLEPKIKAGLTKALADFYEAIKHKAAEQNRGLVERPVELTEASAFHREMLGKSLAFDEGKSEPREADAALMLTGPMRTLFTGAILVDPDLAETLGKRPESITVWGRHSLADALRPATFDLIREQAEAAGWLVLRPEDLFTDALVTLDGQTINEAHPKDFQSALLPLSPLALMLLPDQQIAQNLTLSGGSGRAVVRFKVRLQGGKAHEIRRELPRAESNETLQVPDDLAFWPNFRTPSWHWTFLHFSGNVNYYMRPRFAVTADFITRQIQGSALDASDRARRMRLWADSSTLAIDDLFGNPPPGSELEAKRLSTVKGPQDEILMERIGFYATDTVSELHHLPLGADAIFFARKRPDGDLAPAGMALVRFQDAKSSALEAKVAIDFGTTNTVVYTDRGGKRERLSFEDRIVFPFGVRANQAKRREDLVGQYLGFFPLQKHETPFPTVAKLREFRPGLPPDLQSKVREGLMHQHGFADNVFFIPNFDGFVSRQASLGLGNNIFREWTEKGVLKFRLKWGSTQSERALAKHFLRQIIMMSAAELADEGIDPQSIDWRLSYPQAFSPKARRELEGELRGAWSELFGPPGDTAATGKPPFLRKTEGAAAAHVFVQKGSDKLMLMLDIGGGTTDIALWRDAKPFWRNSFRVAGGDFFTAYLANNPDVLRKIDMGEVSDGLTAGDLSDDGRKDFVELYVNKPAFAKRFADNFGLLASEPVGLGLQHIAFVALGGLMYYVGMVIGRLAADPESGLKRGDLDRITVAFAGRGSTLFRQFHIAGGSEDELTQLVRLAIVAAGFDPAEVAITFRFSGPQEAKHEVAQGLLIDRFEVPGVTESRLAVVGETVQVVQSGADVSVEADAPLTALQNTSEVDRLELAQISQFLIELRKLTGLHVDIQSRGGLAAMQAKVRQQLSDALGELDPEAFFDIDSQPFEPPFITALRELVVLMAKPLAERDESLRVSEA